MANVIEFLTKHWAKTAASITIVSFLFSVILNIINRKTKQHLYFILREVEITSDELMNDIDYGKASLDNCRSSFQSNRSQAAAGMRIINPTPFTREQYEKGAIYCFLLKNFRLVRGVRNGIRKASKMKTKKRKR